MDSCISTDNSSSMTIGFIPIACFMELCGILQAELSALPSSPNIDKGTTVSECQRSQDYRMQQICGTDGMGLLKTPGDGTCCPNLWVFLDRSTKEVEVSSYSILHVEERDPLVS